jgi:uncharacterized protein YehS (DUF1456 family)
MVNNDVMRSIRYLLETDDAHLSALIALGGGTATRAQVTAFLKRDDEPGYAVCEDSIMLQFLDGLITHRRGPGDPAKKRPPEPRLTNNVMLKKLRVAFELTEEDILGMLSTAGFEVSRPELTALFRASTHHNFRPAGDQFFRNFLKGLTLKVRG